MATRRRSSNYYNLNETPTDRKLRTLGTLQALDSDARAADAASVASVLGALSQLYGISGAAQEQRLNELRAPYLQDEYAARVENLRSEADLRNSRPVTELLQSVNYGAFPEEFRNMLLRSGSLSDAMSSYDQLLKDQEAALEVEKRKREAMLTEQQSKKRSAGTRRGDPTDFLKALSDIGISTSYGFHMPYGL